MKRTLFMLALATLVAGSAQAQFKLGKLKDRVKSEVKKEVGKKTTGVVGDEAAAAVGLDDGTEMGSTMNGFNYMTFWKKSFEPTEEALKNDGWADNTTALDYQTKTMKELHAAWDHLPEYYFPFHPYYTDDNKMWYSFDGMYSGQLTLRWMDYMEKCFKAPVGAAFPETTYFPVPGKDYYMPLDGTFRSAYTADFLVDPCGSGTFDNLVRLLCFSTLYYSTEIEYKMDNPEEGLIHNDWFIYKGSQQKYREWVNEREQMCVNLATEVTPIKVVQDNIIENFTNFQDTEKRMIYRLCCGVQALAAYDRILKNHKDYKEDDETNQKIKRLFTLNNDKVRLLSIDFINANKPAQAEPKGVSVDAQTKANGIEQAKDYVGADKFVKVIFESSEWRPFKEQKWPYRIVVYVMPVAIVAKNDEGKNVIHYCDLGKSPDGKTYTIQASNTKDPGPFPLK